MLGAMRARFWIACLLCLPGLGCGVEQAEECQRYVACQSAYDTAFGVEPPTDTSAYDEGGRCWFGNLETAATCAQTCAHTADALFEAASSAGQSLDACQG